MSGYISPIFAIVSGSYSPENISYHASEITNMAVEKHGSQYDTGPIGESKTPAMSEVPQNMH
jgi:type IV secretory pathway ATPase VirB11/archaellum biosynthesis ATPase